VLAIILKSGDAKLGAFAANGWRSGTLSAAFITEVVTTFGFLLVIIGATSKRAPAGSPRSMTSEIERRESASARRVARTVR
jgi:glycerol uptake facilitator-like aquaporin